MTERSLRVLEFTKIRDQLKELAVSDLGGELAGKLAPSANEAEIRHAQEETEEAHVLLTYLGEHPIVPFPTYARRSSSLKSARRCRRARCSTSPPVCARRAPHAT